MSDSQHNSHPDDNRLLEAIEGVNARVKSAAGLDAASESMRQDRAALQTALKADLARPLSRELTSRFNQSVRDEIDQSLLANLAQGRPLEDHLPISKVAPIRMSPFSKLARAWEDLRLSRGLAVAAGLAIVAGFTWLALRPAGSSISQSPLATKTPSGELPQWATLPDRPVFTHQPEIVQPIPVVAPEKVRIAQVTQTRDAATALAWSRQGILAIRVVSNSPMRDQQRLTALAADTRKRSWDLSASSPAGLAAIPSSPWPIDGTLVDADPKSVPSRDHPLTATIAGFDLSIRPTAATLQSIRDDLERDLSSTVTFERVDELAQYPARQPSDNSPSSAADVIWWTKPAGEWTLRVHIPLLLEYGSRPKSDAGTK